MKYDFKTKKKNTKYMQKYSLKPFNILSLILWNFSNKCNKPKIKMNVNSTILPSPNYISLT